MSRISGEKARAHVEKKRRTAMREKSRAIKADATGTAGEKKPGGKPMAARAAKREAAAAKK
jgi:hypothetical protein